MTSALSVYGSDVIVEILHRLDIRHASLNPGASFRGIHESLAASTIVKPITCLFEGTVISLAHGYAKATGRPMAALVHNLVGLQHASMGIFNAYSDGVPVIVIGGSGPSDRTRRRPWIDWVHTPSAQGLVVRPYVKWEAQPVSLAEVPEVFARAYQMAVSGIPGPSYVAVDADIQERPANPLPGLEEVRPRRMPPLTVADEVLESLADALSSADLPVIVADNVGRTRAGYEAVIEIAEHLAAPVVDLGGRHSFPNTHWADLTFDRTRLLAEADVVFCVDPRDATWATTAIDQETRETIPLMRVDARLLVISMNELANRSFIEREPVVRTDDHITADSEVALPRLAELVRRRQAGPERRRRQIRDRSASVRARNAVVDRRSDVLTEGHAIASVHDEVSLGPWQLVFPGFRNWVRRTWTLDRWNAHLGGSGGAGLGYGPGAAVGAALGLEDSDRLVVTIQPDGDLLYDPTALWTAAHERLPLLTVVIENGTYGADRVHQARMAEYRGGRSATVAHIGVDFDDPRIDTAALANAQGVAAWTVSSPDDLGRVADAVSYVRTERLPAVLSMRTPKPEVSGLG